MKNVITRLPFKVILLTGFLLAVAIVLPAQEKTKTFEKTISGVQHLNVNHRRGLLEVLPSADGQIKVVATLKASGFEEKSFQTFVDHLQFNVSGVGERGDVQCDLGIENWNITFGKTKIRFRDGVVLSDDGKIDLHLTVYVPKLQSLQLTNKYDDIRIAETVDADLKIELYSSDLHAKDVKGKVDLNLKYGKAYLGNYENGNFVLYDSELDAGNGKLVQLNSKYSEVSMGSAGALSIISYDDNITVGRVSGDLTINDKYSDYRVDGFHDGDLQFYDANVTFGKANNLKINSKYTEFKIQSAETATFSESYDDAVTIESLKHLETISKYTNYTIGALSGKIQMTSYDDELLVRKVNGLEGMTFDGKYTEVTLPLSSTVKYQLDAMMTYSELLFPESDFDMIYYREKGDKKEIRGKRKGAGEQSPMLKIVSYDGDIKLQ